MVRLLGAEVDELDARGEETLAYAGHVVVGEEADVGAAGEGLGGSGEKFLRGKGA